MRALRVLLCSGALERTPGGVVVSKDYVSAAERRSTIAEQARVQREFATYPLRYQILRCRPGLPLAITKLKYLLACRRTHPDAGGDAEAFLRVSLAYQDVMKDYGVETVDNAIVNLGNVQVDDSEVRNYLDARARITSYIPVSTLDDHIARIEAVKARLGEHVTEQLSANDDEAVWLLEDIEEMMEETGLKTVRLRVVEDGKLRLLPQHQLTDGTERPLFLASTAATDAAAAAAALSSSTTTTSSSASNADAAAAAATAAVTTAGAAETAADVTLPRGGSGNRKKDDDNNDAQDDDDGDGKQRDRAAAHGAEGHDDIPVASAAPREVQVHRDDIDVLTAKHTLHDRCDVAGLAARTATEVMHNTTEVQHLRLSVVVLLALTLSLLTAVFVYLDGLARVRTQKKLRPEVAQHLQADTMLPWWGNDVEYERQVKRIFVEEWRHARASARRAQTRQEGIARESLDDDVKKEMDVRVFTVTAAKLHAMRERAAEQRSTQLRGAV